MMVTMNLDAILQLFTVTQRELGEALGAQSPTRSARHFGTLLGLTVAISGEEGPSLYGSVFHVDGSDLAELENAAAHVTRMFWAAHERLELELAERG